MRGGNHGRAQEVRHGRGHRVRFKAKREDFPSREAQKEAVELSAHIVMQMRDTAANTFGLMESLGKQLEEQVGMEHTPHADFDPERDN